MDGKKVLILQLPDQMSQRLVLYVDYSRSRQVRDSFHQLHHHVGWVQYDRVHGDKEQIPEAVGSTHIAHLHALSQTYAMRPIRTLPLTFVPYLLRNVSFEHNNDMLNFLHLIKLQLL